MSHSPLLPTMITLPPADVIVVTAFKPLETGTRRKVARVRENIKICNGKIRGIRMVVGEVQVVVAIPAGDISVHVVKSLAADDEKTVPGLLLASEFPVPTAYPLPLLSMFTPAYHMNLKRNAFMAITFSDVVINGSLHPNAIPKNAKEVKSAH
jgi:hypothetical protein